MAPAIVKKPQKLNKDQKAADDIYSNLKQIKNFENLPFSMQKDIIAKCNNPRDRSFYKKLLKTPGIINLMAASTKAKNKDGKILLELLTDNTLLGDEETSERIERSSNIIDFLSKNPKLVKFLSLDSGKTDSAMNLFQKNPEALIYLFKNVKEGQNSLIKAAKKDPTFIKNLYEFRKPKNGDETGEGVSEEHADFVMFVDKKIEKLDIKDEEGNDGLSGDGGEVNILDTFIKTVLPDLAIDEYAKTGILNLSKEAAQKIIEILTKSGDPQLAILVAAVPAEGGPVPEAALLQLISSLAKAPETQGQQGQYFKDEWLTPNSPNETDYYWIDRRIPDNKLSDFAKKANRLVPTQGGGDTLSKIKDRKGLSEKGCGMRSFMLMLQINEGKNLTAKAMEEIMEEYEEAHAKIKTQDLARHLKNAVKDNIANKVKAAGRMANLMGPILPILLKKAGRLPLDWKELDPNKFEIIGAQDIGGMKTKIKEMLNKGKAGMPLLYTPGSMHYPLYYKTVQNEFAHIETDGVVDTKKGLDNYINMMTPQIKSITKELDGYTKIIEKVFDRKKFDKALLDLLIFRSGGHRFSMVTTK